jgi:spore coat protein A, manganese oxidase
VLSRRTLLRGSVVGAAGVALPATLYRVAGLNAVAPAAAGTTIPHRHSISAADLGPAAVQSSTVPLPLLTKAKPVGRNTYRIVVGAATVTMHPTLGSATRVFGYDDSSGRGVKSPGYTIEVTKGTPTSVTYVNSLPAQHLFDNEVPDYMHSGSPVRMSTHLHGGHVAGDSDGNPYAYPAEYVQGQVQNVVYPNDQNATLLWYHDHSDQITRLNVYAGLAGLYIVRDGADTGAEPNGLGVPGGGYEIPLVITDRAFDSSGQLFYSPDSTWLPEFFGNSPVVNGAVQPYLNVEPRMYRFRVLNASNARFWNLTVDGTPPMVQIGSDGGLFDRPVPLSQLLLLPAERADIVIDFSKFAGKTLTVRNPDLPADVSSPAEALPTVMEFRVGKKVTHQGPPKFPTTLPGSMPALGAPSLTRVITLEEAEDPITGEPAYGSLNGRKFDDQRGVTEQPKVGTTEDWKLVNLTEDTHPIHVHLVQFQVLDRTPFDANAYAAALDEARAADPDAPNPDATPYLTGPAVPPDANERGWKDTVRANPGQVTRIRMRWDLPAGVAGTQKYVYHCHILEHEDNSMMRPLQLQP